MKKMKMAIVLLFFLNVIAACIVLFCIRIYAMEQDDENTQYIPMDATAYCYGSTRCDGGNTYDGICAAKKEWYGKVAAIYEDDGSGNLGKFIGYYECLDTGGEAIREGKTIDIYHPSYDWCRKFGRKKVLVMLIDGEG